MDGDKYSYECWILFGEKTMADLYANESALPRDDTVE